MRIFKRITTMCFKDGKMSRDPFCNYKLKKVKKDRGYLTKAELERIIDFEPDNKRLEKVRDIFVFCCFTGFDYLGSGINRRGCLIQYQHRRQTQHHPCDTKELLLSL